MKAQAVYDLPDLAAKMGMTAKRAKRYLTKMGVKVTCPGERSKSTVLLSDIREAFPDLYASLEEAAHLNRVKG